MNMVLEQILNKAYSLVNKSGLLNTTPEKYVFCAAYFSYKRLLEDPLIVLLKMAPKICRNGLIIDLDANLGYTILMFSEYAGAGCAEIAFEPDRDNFNSLREVVAGRAPIVPVWTTVGEQCG